MVLSQLLEIELNNYSGAFGETKWYKAKNILRVIYKNKIKIFLVCYFNPNLAIN
jgi:hypothetical protein